MTSHTRGLREPTPPAGFLQFTFPEEVSHERFCGCFGVQVRLFGLTFPGKPFPSYAERLLPVQVNCRKEAGRGR